MGGRWLGVGIAACVVAPLTGCYSGLTDGFGGPEGQADGGDDAGAADAGSDDADGSGDDGGDDGSDGEPVPQCEGLEIAAAPLRRLTGLEYDNTVHQLLGDQTQPASSFAPDESVAGFSANAVAPLSALQLDQYFTAAERLASEAVAERWDTVVGCDVADADCIPGFVASFGRRALRRPVTDEEHASYLALYEQTATAVDADAGVEVLIAAMLMSPSFLYHVEPSEGDDEGPVVLGGYAMASRLSYFVWNSMPDDELFDLAEAGMLADAEVVQTQVRRMLDDQRAASTIASFHRQWLSIDGLGEAVKDAELFPEWTVALGEAMEHETIAFADEVIRRGDGSLHTLLTASWSVVDADLAALYGVPAPQAGFAVTELDPEQRAGVLTHASFLASNAHAAENSWVHRGKFVRERLLCSELPAPPPGVEVNDANDPDRLETPECASCHTLMDPIGTGLDNYSPIGAFQTVDDSGETIDGSGEVVGITDVGTFDGGVELAHALAGAPQVGDCMATQWFRYATRRKETPDDACTVSGIRAAFSDSGQDIRELMVAIASSDAFRFHTAS